jgi:hypothetical protein
MPNTMREKPYYKLESERVVKVAACSLCGCKTAIEQCWCESGRGVTPDDYVYVKVCADCNKVISNSQLD